MLQWSPDSTTLAAFRIEPGDRKEVHVLQSSPPGGGRAKLQTRAYDLPGDKLAAFELNLFRMEPTAETDSKPGARPDGDAAVKWKAIKPAVERIDLGTPRLRWRPDGRSFSYTKTERGHQRFRLIEIETATGSAREIIDERTETYIWTAHTENVRLDTVNWLERSGEIIYVSERDGWRHLYLIDAGDGKFKNQITKGEWIVRGIDRIDEENRQIWFRASGMNPDQDPYLVHFCRVNFDGSGLIALTAGNGNHTIQFSPDNKFIIDTYSRVDMSPVNELRRVSDGSLVCELERTDTSELTESGWEPPEVFVAKGRDGTTDIWGIICRPRDFDPNRKYPVIEDIYAGPQGSFVPKTFSPQRRYALLTDLGFVVAKIDGMGTANRSKAFHDVCWKN
jgi:dipeptidyl aminopeptidase/acylaminoacyl peptidase